MPVSYHIDVSQKLLRTVCYGDVRFEDVVAHFQSLSKDPECPELVDVLLDFSGMKTSPSTDQVRVTSSIIGELSPRVRFGTCAIITGNDVLYGQGRIFQSYTSTHFRLIEVFRDLAEAEAWLMDHRTAK
jgi:hypothetical protein